MPALLSDLPALLRELESDISDRHLTPQQRAQYLDHLKVLGRTADQSSPLFAREAIRILCLHSFTLNHNEPKAELEALRCLANCLFLAPKTRAILVDLGFASTPVEQLQDVSFDKEFVLSRIMFFETYEPSYPLEQVVTDHDLDSRIEKILRRHALRYTLNQGDAQLISNEMALVETLKLVFNISHHLNIRGLFTSSLPHILKMLLLHPLIDYPLQPPVSQLVNSLLNIDIMSSTDVFPPEDPKMFTGRLLHILDKALEPNLTQNKLPDHNVMDTVLSPLLVLLQKVFESAPEDVALDMKAHLLPSVEDRAKPLGTGSALSARLLRLSNSPSTPQARACAGELLYRLSSSNPEEFIRNVGYGFASGYLVNNKIPVPPEALANDGYNTGTTKPVNPITGQNRESEPNLPDPFADMTDEEKEREAERLFVLFERLKKTGVIDVKNPVQQAVEEGRFEELDDDGKPRRY